MPGAIEVQRSSKPLPISCDAKGHDRRKVLLEPGLEPVALANLIFGGVIVGLAVDHVTGALYRYPEEVEIALPKAPDSASGESGTQSAYFDRLRSEVRDAADLARNELKKSCKAGDCAERLSTIRAREARLLRQIEMVEAERAARRRARSEEASSDEAGSGDSMSRHEDDVSLSETGASTALVPAASVRQDQGSSHFGGLY